jgi:hypothetical protein
MAKPELDPNIIAATSTLVWTVVYFASKQVGTPARSLLPVVRALRLRCIQALF